MKIVFIVIILDLDIDQLITQLYKKNKLTLVYRLIDQNNLQTMLQNQPEAPEDPESPVAP